MTSNANLPPGELEARLRFEELLVDLSARFVSLPPEQVDQQIRQAQRSVCEHLNISRSGLWLFHEDEPAVMRLAHFYLPADDLPILEDSEPALWSNREWVIGQTSPPILMHADAKAFFPYLFERVKRGETMAISSVGELPAEAEADREILRRYGILSVVIVPMSAGGTLLGCLTFDVIRAERQWAREIVKRFELIAQVFAGVLARSRAELRLRESEARFRSVADSAPVLIWMSGIDKRCNFFNKPWLEFTGRTMEQEWGDGWAQGVHGEDLAACLKLYTESFEARRPFMTQYRLRRHDGEYRWVSDNGVPLFDAQGNFAGYIGSCVDVTERIVAEEQLRGTVEEVKRLHDQLQQQNVYLREQVRGAGGVSAMVGESRASQRILEQARRVSATDSAVLISGETGSGKELLAHTIHELSTRGRSAMIAVNCAALPGSLIESELFGREKGAYTGAMTRQQGRFEAAHGSTLFLDEIAELPVDLQTKLLRVLEEGKFERLGSTRTLSVDVRIIAATNRNLGEMVHAGQFRADLYYRLNVFPIEVPPLRERREDIPLLVWKFVRHFAEKMGKSIETISGETIEQLQRYSWPGNVRELRNLMERAVILSDSRVLQVEMPSTAARVGVTEVVTLEEAERAHILSALERTGWRISGMQGAAEILGLVPTTLHSKMKKLGIVRQSIEGLRRRKKRQPTDGVTSK